MIATCEQRQRIVRSFVSRGSRMTTAQQRAFDSLLAHYTVAPGPVKISELFTSIGPTVLEIGFGDGESLLEQAHDNPGTHYIGIETYRPGIGHLLLRLRELGLDNVKIIYDDAAQVVAQRIEDGSLDCIQIFFPDPWPKKRHHKRRLIQPRFGELLARKLKPGGRLHLATDWENYARHMLEVLSAIAPLDNCYESYAVGRQDRPVTKFERRGQRLGHPSWDLVFRRG